MINRINIAFGGLAVICAAITVGSATHAVGQSMYSSPVTVEGHKFDPETMRIVQYSDLNLQSVLARRELLHRVSYAVNDLCQINGPSNWTGLEFYLQGKQCYHVTWSSVQPQVDRAFRVAGSGFVSAAILVAVPQK